MAAIPIPGVNTPTYQTWGAAVAGKLNAVGWASFTGTTDGEGWLTIPASTVGLSNISGAVVTMRWPHNVALTHFASNTIINGTNIQVRLVGIVYGSPGNISKLSSYAGATVDVFAWGT